MEDIEARQPRQAEADFLRLTVGQAVLEVARTVYSADDTEPVKLDETSGGLIYPCSLL